MLPDNPIFVTGDPAVWAAVVEERLISLGCSSEHAKTVAAARRERMVQVKDAYEASAILTGKA
jgi:hypothetical protein